MADAPVQRRRYALLDRDGTLIVYRPYLRSSEQVELVPGVVEGLRDLLRLGLGLVVLTNQSGIARGYFAAEDVERIHSRIRQDLAVADVAFDGFYYCPHAPENHCVCRKPEPGLAIQAARELDFDLADSFLIGDNACDVHLGARIGATTFLVKNRYSVGISEAENLVPDYVVGDLREAARIIATRVAVPRQPYWRRRPASHAGERLR